MLRLVLLENLRRLAEQMLRGWDERAPGRGLGRPSTRRPGRRRGRGAGRGDAAGRRRRPSPSLTDPFVVRLLQLLRDQGPRPPRRSSGSRPSSPSAGRDANEVLRREHRRQAANQVSVGNCVISLRLLSALDWNAFFEQHSRGRGDPPRRPVGRLPAAGLRHPRPLPPGRREDRPAARTPTSEASPAAPSSWPAPGRPRAGRAGTSATTWSIAGRPRSRPRSATGPAWRERLLDWALAHPAPTYFGVDRSPCSALLAGPRRRLGLAAGRAAVVGSARCSSLALLLPASELAVGLVNHLLTLLLPPRVLPKLDFKEGIPADCATFVVMPDACWSGRRARAALLERLEIHYLANPDPQLRFALLTDFADAPDEHMPEDDGYVRAALDGVKALNAALRRRRARPVLPLPPPAASGTRSQGCWMGWERKRGKLSEFNRLLRGRPRRRATPCCSGDPAQLPRDPLRDHARRRHPAAARHGPAAGRHAGPPAQPAAVRPGERPRRRGLRRARSRGSAST